ncbi:MAG: FKBP-type peptidyl-prolyl cis-trans isomerase [Anaerolineae bacterium]|nr:FKBP-type peptidyl-prolyl cis-trans isomerase [Anaerolineae bacterium]MDQ7033311.1 FKBP-type peptidyl-prolyl cis-trans isomerase [Anaerolineae bacterium]
MKLTEDKVGALAFTIYVDGVEKDTVPKDDPMEYLHGGENIVPGLEEALDKQAVGYKFDVTLKPEDAYGDYDKEAMIEVDLDEFDEEGTKPEVGLEVEMLDEDGDIIEGRIMTVGADVVTVDLNHELAGKTVRYVGEIVEIREATEDELEWGFPESLLNEMFDEDELELVFEDDED